MSYILIVDDESDIRELIAEGLTRIGHEVLEAENGGKALEIIQTKPIKLLVTDIRMPGGDGISLIKTLKEQALKKFPVIVMTGFSDMSPDDIVALGANQVLLKPFRFKEFVDILKTYLE
jgi:two-component system OmpR family response regulator